jgi:rare lipoprotein A
VRLMTPVRACVLGTTLICAVPGAALAQETQTIPMRLADDRVVFGAPAVATGNAGPEAAGRTAVLEFRTGSQAWRPLAQTMVRESGRYRLLADLPGRGVLRVTLAPVPGAATAAAAASSLERPIAVLARVTMSHTRLDVRPGRRAKVAGRVAPGTAGRQVALQVRREGRWRTLDRVRTREHGRYRLAARTGFVGSLPVRVNVAGGGVVDARRRAAGRLNSYRVAHASWYGPGLYGNHLGCGGTLGYGTLGVAHKTLPCGTPVTLRRGDRSIRVRVIDRGPYVGGREYDLTEATARAIGFSGHGPLLVTR